MQVKGKGKADEEASTPRALPRRPSLLYLITTAVSASPPLCGRWGARRTGVISKKFVVLAVGESSTLLDCSKRGYPSSSRPSHDTKKTTLL